MEDFFGIAGFFLTMVIIFGGFQWLAAKFFGVKYHGRFDRQQALQREEEQKQMLLTCSEEDIAEGVERCRKKGYAKTYSNVLTEVVQLIKEREKRTLSDKLKRNIDDLKMGTTDFISNITGDKYEKLRKLGELRDKGVLTTDEFETEKRKILK